MNSCSTAKPEYSARMPAKPRSKDGAYLLCPLPSPVASILWCICLDNYTLTSEMKRANQRDWVAIYWQMVLSWNRPVFDLYKSITLCTAFHNKIKNMNCMSMVLSPLCSALSLQLIGSMQRITFLKSLKKWASQLQNVESRIL